jgi:hypothetical protein
MTDRLPGEEWREYHQRTGCDYTTWRCQVEVEADATIRQYRESMTHEEREAASQRGLEVVRELMGEWNDIRAQLKD